jgi:hypothetical protein
VEDSVLVDKEVSSTSHLAIVTFPDEASGDLVSLSERPQRDEDNGLVVCCHGIKDSFGKGYPSQSRNVFANPSRELPADLVNKWLEVHLSKAFVVKREAQIVPQELTHFDREVRQEVQNVNVGAPNGEDLRLGDVGDEARGFTKKV